METLEYNTQRDLLKIKEYGRNVQQMVLHLKTVEDSEKRNKLAAAIVKMMAQTNPQQKNNPDFQQKLWNHLFQIADYKLDIEHEITVTEPEEGFKDIPKLAYPKKNPRYRHYGKGVELMIEEALILEGEKQEAYVKLILSYMKSAYLNWSKDNVNDENIYSDLDMMSKSQLPMNRTQRIYAVAPSPSSSKGKSNNYKKNNQSNSNKRNFKKKKF